MITMTRAPSIVLALGLLMSIVSAGQPVKADRVIVTPTPYPTSSDSWVIVDLPPDASQVEYGQEIYRLVCSACHGDRGQGLTAEWRSTWAPKDQNCWQSKCHGLNHPQDGFMLPYSPPVTGPAVKARFKTALDLYQYNRLYMPWHDPNSLTESENWSVTAYLLKLNSIDPGPMLNADMAARIYLAPRAAPTAVPARSPVEPAADSSSPANTGAVSWWLIPIVLAVVIVLAISMLWRRRRAA